MKILVAEDDVISALVLRRTLEKLGHDVWIEPDGARAWELLRGQQFRIVMSDWMMPRMTGLELCRSIREREGRPYVYFILLTVKSSAEDRQIAMSSGIDDFLIKPIDPADIVTRIEVAQRIINMKDLLESGALSSTPARAAGKAEIGAILLEKGVITYSQLQSALTEQKTTGQRLGEILCANGWACEEDIARARGEQMDVPYLAVRDVDRDESVLSLVSYAIAKRYRMLPLTLGPGDNNHRSHLQVAMENPWDYEAIALVERLAGYRIDAQIAAPDALGLAIEEAYRKRQASRAVEKELASVGIVK